MLENQSEIKRIFSTTIKMFQEQGDTDLTAILKDANIYSKTAHYDSWNGGTQYYELYLEIDARLVAINEEKISDLEKRFKKKFEIFLRGVENEFLSEVIIIPVVKQYIDWNTVRDITTKNGLIKLINKIKATMISVSTGGPKIQLLDKDYQSDYKIIDEILDKLKIDNPNTYQNLWQWYGHWSSGSLTTYHSRRKYINNLFSDLVQLIEKSDDTVQIDQPYELTGWMRVDRSVSELRKRMNEAEVEEQFQAIGLISRESIISLAQAVYDPEIHGSLDGVTPSNTDAKRMLEAFIAHQLGGPSNESYRKYAKAALILANDLTHRRTATTHQASICAIAVSSLVNIVKVISKKTIIRF